MMLPRRALLTAVALLLLASATLSPRAAVSAAGLSLAIAVTLRLGGIGNLWARVLLTVAAAHGASLLLARLPFSLPVLWALTLAAVAVTILAGARLLRDPLRERTFTSRGALTVAGLCVIVWMPRLLLDFGDPLAALRRMHPTRQLPAVTLDTGDWRETAASLEPLRAAGDDVYRQALEHFGLTELPVARLALLGGRLRLAGGNPCISLDYSDARQQLAVLRADGEFLLYTPRGRIIHLFTGELPKAAKLHTTPDGAGFLCLFEHGETRYFGAPSPWAATGELKYGMGRVVDFAFLEDHDLLALNAVGALYRMREGDAFTEVAPPLFPGVDMARGLVVQDGEPWILDRHGALHGPHGALAFARHAFRAPADDAVALRSDGKVLYWLDAWGGLHGCIAGEQLAFGDLALRFRRGGCTDFAFIAWANRVLVLADFGEISSYDLARYALHPNAEAQR